MSGTRSVRPAGPSGHGDFAHGGVRPPKMWDCSAGRARCFPRGDGPGPTGDVGVALMMIDSRLKGVYDGRTGTGPEQRALRIPRTGVPASSPLVPALTDKKQCARRQQTAVPTALA